jgi:hypothetical protein
VHFAASPHAAMRAAHSHSLAAATHAAPTAPPDPIGTRYTAIYMPHVPTHSRRRASRQSRTGWEHSGQMSEDVVSHSSMHEAWKR